MAKDNCIPAASCVYRIINKITGKVYIGSTCDLRHRMAVHWTDLKYGKHKNYVLQQDWNMFGESTFVLEILELCERKDLREREQCYLDSVEIGDRYNLCPNSASSLGLKQREGSGLRKSLALKGKIVWSEASRQKQSLSKKGIRFSEDRRHKHLIGMMKLMPLSQSQIAEVKSLLDQGWALRPVAKLYKVSTRTIHRIRHREGIYGIAV